MEVTVQTHRQRFVIVVALAAILAAAIVVEMRPPAAAAAETARDLAAAPPESVGVSSERLRRLDAAMKRMVDDGRLAGVVTLMARKGRVVNFNAVGKKDVGAPDPIGKDSIFRIYSMTKPITGVAMMMLYEEGKWRVDDPVSRYIPEFAALTVHTGENADGSLKVEPARRSMTMRELMTHSGGLGYVLNEQNPVDRLYRDRRVLDSSAPLENMIDGLATLPLIAQPGTRWYYSIAVDVQGYLVEKLSGQPFDEFLRRRIFEPLGMKDTAFHVPTDKLSRLALVHAEGESGRLAVTSMGGDPTIVPKGPSGGGGLFSTAEDYARFCQMLLNGGEWKGTRLLAPRTVEMMRTNHLRAEPLATARAGTGFGMDFAVVLDPAEAGEPYSEGTYYWAGAAGTWFWIDPLQDFAFIGMIQHRGRAVADVQGVSRNLTYQAILD
jgi:CubicO group peptidase (beta-lactamase class C family)